ncbi:MAG: tRNA pseudouridine(55) synthase TruB, partial [Cyanobacteria bacterium J083]
SHDCVAKLRGIFKTKKIGHGGTLDPAATGVLPIAVGKATRLLNYLPSQKTYRGIIRLGVATNTDDLEGEVIARQPASHLTLEDIKTCLVDFQGKITQIPPAFSAIKKNGQKLYQLARRGEKIEIPSRTVEIEQIRILQWCPGELPELEVEIVCQAGTYIRAIARDLGNQLGVGGTLASLSRTASGGMKLSESLTFAKLEQQIFKREFSLLSPHLILAHLPEINLDLDAATKWCQGQKITITLPSYAQINLTKSSVVKVLKQDNIFLGLGEVTQLIDSYQLSPKVVCS